MTGRVKTTFAGAVTVSVERSIAPCLALDSDQRSGRKLLGIPARERLYSCPSMAQTTLVRSVALIAFGVLLSATSLWARQASQDARRDSVPLVPSILKSDITIPEPCPHTASMEPKRYMIMWNDTPGIDGNFILVLHPKQVFLRSAHDNPNPNYVYWVAPLSDAQYTRLVTFIDGYKGRLFRRNRWDRWAGYTLFTLENPRISPHFPERRTPDSEAAWQRDFDAAVNANLRRILRELNRALSQDEALRLDAAINRYPDIVRIAE